MGYGGHVRRVLVTTAVAGRRLPRWSALLVGLLLVVFLAFVDLATGYEVSFSIFYLTPVLLVTWLAGHRLGLLVAFTAACTWGAMDLLAGHTYSAAWIPVWNSIVRLGFFSVGVMLLGSLSKSLSDLNALALTDSLTGAHNTRSFYSQFEHEIARHTRNGRPLTVAYLDLDHFKEVNDTLGHAAGDSLLRSVAALLTDSLRAVDVVARLGGDEFGILMPETGAEAAALASTRIHAAITEAIRALAPGVQDAGVTIGAVVFEHPPESPDHAVGVADTLMYQGKDDGRGVVRLAIWNRSGLAEQ